MSEPPLVRVEELFCAAAELPIEQRGRFLDEACGNEALRREVEELLTVHGTEATRLQDLTDAIAEDTMLEIDNAAGPREVGPYRVLRAIGHGGVGVVYLAERVDGQFDQVVALKLLHLDMLQSAIQARFLAERQMLARLTHPNIARLLDGGVTDEGRPYIVMEYVAGQPITEFCREQRLGVSEVLRLFLALVEAVSYLHRNLIVHRDIKPNNILVDRDGCVRLLDFGIAKVLDAGPEIAERTVTGERLLTPAYAAPEQALDAPITTATDVYSLGVLLYELLTGGRPFESPRRPFQEGAASIRPPSVRIRADLAGGGSSEAGSPGAILGWRQVAGDLDTICLMALRPEPERRYASAEHLGQDIERHLRGLPVLAQKNTLGYRFGKWIRRHRIEAIGGFMLVLLLLAGFVRERGLRNLAEQARVAAQEEAVRSVAVSEFLGELLSSVDPGKAQGEEVTVADVLDEADSRLEGEHALVGHAAAEAEVRLTLGRTYTSLSRFEEARPHLERALELRGGEEAADLEALRVVEALGILSYRSGRLDEAEGPLLRVLELRTRLLGEEHPDTLATMGHLANLYWFQERLDQAELLDRRTLEVRQRVLGPDHPDSLRAMNGLATTLFARALYLEAANYFEVALLAQREQLGEDHPDTLRLKNNLAAANTELGRYKEAEPLLREVAEGRSRVLGEQSGVTGTSWHNLGVTLFQLGRYEEAEAVLQRAISIRTGRDPPAAWLYTRSSLADLYRDTGRLSEAETIYRDTIRGQSEELGPEHALTQKTSSSLAALLLLRGDLEDAEDLITGVLDVQDPNLGAGHPDTLGSRSTLVEIRLAQGQIAEAFQIADEAVKVGAETLGREHPVVEETRFQLTRALLALGEPQQAEALIAGIYEARRLRVGEDHPQTRKAAEVALEIYRTLGRSKDAARYEALLDPI